VSHWCLAGMCFFCRDNFSSKEYHWPVETVPGIRGRGMRESSGRVNSRMTFDIL
jgi:hypothetical protein